MSITKSAPDFLGLFVGQRSLFSIGADSTKVPVSTLCALEGGTPMTLRWKYEGDDEAFVGEYFFDVLPARKLMISTLDESAQQVLRPSNLAGDGLVILDSGTLLAYGDAAINCPAVTNAVQAVNTGDSYFAVLRSNGSVNAWGLNLQHTVHDVAGLAATASAITAIKKNNTVYSWGNPSYGGSAPALEQVRSVAPGSLGFIARHEDGRVSSWGEGTAPPELGNVKVITGNGPSFTAIEQDGSVKCWGDSNTGGNTPVITNPVEFVVATDWAFAAVREDGYVNAWGHREWGGVVPPILKLKSVVKIVGTASSFAALDVNGKVYAWGSKKFGGDAPEELDNVKNLVATSHGIAALKKDGTVQSWGYLSDVPLDMESELVNIQAVLCNGLLFFALRQDGRVFVWGSTTLSNEKIALLQRNFSYFA